MSNTPTIAALEALLFLSAEPLAVSKIAKLLSCSRKEALSLCHELRERHKTTSESSLQLIEHDDHVELATKGEYATFGDALAKSVYDEKLSRPSLEVLAIIAYKVPITRAQIEAIRGVNCSFTLRTLLLRGLIERHENPQDIREYLYQPTFRLLEQLGLGSVQDLPDYETLAHDERLESVSSVIPEEEISSPT